MSNRATAEKVYKYIELNQLDKLADFIREKDLTGISLVSIIDVLVNQYDYSIEDLEKKGAIVEIEALLLDAQYHLQQIKKNPGLKAVLKNLKQGLDQLIEFWKKGNLRNEAAEQFLNSQAIRLMQNSWQHGAKEVDEYVKENTKKQLKTIYSQWLANEDVDQEIMKKIDEMVENGLFTNWKKDPNFNEAIQQKLTKNVIKLLLNDYQTGQLSVEMTDRIETLVTDMLLGLVRNETLGQYPKLETYFSSTVAILLKGSKPFDMTPTYTQSFQKIILDCRSGVLGGEIAIIIKQYVQEAIEATKFSSEQTIDFEKKAVQELIFEFKQNVAEVPEALQSFAEDSVNNYLENKYLNDSEFGVTITSRVINLLLVEWKSMESLELKKAVESIVMQNCTDLTKEIDKSISNTDLLSRLLQLEEKNAQLITALSQHGITIQSTENETVTVIDSTTPTLPGKNATAIGLFGSREVHVVRQDETPTLTANSPR